MRWTAVVLLLLGLLVQALGGVQAAAVRGAGWEGTGACVCCSCGGHACCARPAESPVDPSPAPPVRVGGAEENWVAVRCGGPAMGSQPCVEARGVGWMVSSVPVIPRGVPLFLQICALLL